MKIPVIKISWPLWAGCAFKIYCWLLFFAVKARLISATDAIKLGEKFVKKHTKIRVVR